MTDQEKIDELTKQIADLNAEKTQLEANVTKLTNEYKEKVGELDKKEQEIINLKASNMALALRGSVEKKDANEILADMFCGGDKK